MQPAHTTPDTSSARHGEGDRRLLEWLEQRFPEQHEAVQRDAHELLYILDREEADEASRVAGVLLYWPELADGGEDVAARFGAEAAELLDKARYLDGLSAAPDETRKKAQGPVFSDEKLRRLILAMVDDVRVVVVGLAVQLLRLRRLRDGPEAACAGQAQVARRVFAPLANRLGLWEIKWELEDLCFRFLNPNIYHALAFRLDEKRTAREQRIAGFTGELGRRLADAGLAAEITGRPKHLYSAWKKMQAKNLEFHQLWDLLAVRVICNTVEDCYTALGVLNQHWEQRASEYADYIATPKDNGYQSIHTVIMLPDERAVEVQIRTRQMHRESELGDAAHWRYKEQAGESDDIDRKVVWLRRLLEWKNEMLLAQPHDRAVSERVFVFTPMGSIIDLPAGATPIDFAYAVHTEVGHRTRGALVNGKMTTLNHKLATGDRVQIQTTREGAPSRDWIGSGADYVKTSRARNRIQQWFKRADAEQYMAQGRQMLERELKRLGMEDVSYERIAGHTHFQGVNDLLTAIGSGDYKLSRALAPFRTPADPVADPAEARPAGKSPGARSRRASLLVQGMDNVLTHIAACCGPAPGDDVIGYTSTARGITVHRADCVNVTGLEPRLRERLVRVEWGETARLTYTLALRVRAVKHAGLPGELTELLKGMKIEIARLNVEADEEPMTTLLVELEVAGDVTPDRVIQAIGALRRVESVERRAS